MNTVRQKFRPQHQVLVLKCYPRFQKNVQEVKPNSSELSYLLYYATTRRSKLQKVGLFIEKKTAGDVRKLRLGNVQVTLQILTALIEKAPRDLPLYSDHVLAILETVLHSHDINMIEESLPTFETYCKYQDASSLAADPDRVQQYHTIVALYASFASSEFLSSRTPKLSRPLVVRWRAAGIRAIRSMVDAEALATDAARQLNTVIPVILENLHANTDEGLASLQEKMQPVEKQDIQVARKRRTSIATVTTADATDGNPTWASGTTAESDRAADDEGRALAVRCLKQIFAAGTGSNRGQVLLATNLTLKFIIGKHPPTISLQDSSKRSSRKGNWSTSLIEAVARWTPVQDRFIIVIAAVDALVQSSTNETKLEPQLAIATMIDWLLSSSINLIGLSVMDVLLAFVQHVLLLLQLDGRESRKKSPDDLRATLASHVISEKDGQTDTSPAKSASPARQALLLRLQKCIGDLATHIYYTDQISDMVSAVLARLKPSVSPEAFATTTAIENPTATANAVANAQNLREDPNTDGFFSFATARLTALRAVKDILVVANRTKSLPGPAAEIRSRVSIQVWEGTQWLLRDDDREVRMAYVDALLTWLKLETNKTDLLLPKEGPRKSKINSRKEANLNGEIKLAKRAVSNASKKENKVAKSTFLQLLHLGIYENALETPQTDSDALLLHLLLTSLVERLGANAVRHGLPMIARLQSEIQSGETDLDPSASVGVASLVHGYFWALSEKFDFETSRIGGEIHLEISRRKQNDLWLNQIRLPPLQLDNIIKTRSPLAEKELIVPNITPSSFKPYTTRSDLVEEICNSYNQSLISPPSSPPSSPGRIFSVPALTFGYGYSLSPPPKPSQEDQVSPAVKEELVSEWSKDAVIAAAEKERSLSLSGSKSGTGSARFGRNLLAVDNTNEVSRRPSPVLSDAASRGAQEAGPRMSSMAYALNGGLGNLQRMPRLGSGADTPQALTPTSSRDSTIRVTDLKKALSGEPSVLRQASPLGGLVARQRDVSANSARSRASSGSDSMVSFSGTDGGGSNRDLATVEQSDFAAVNGQPAVQSTANRKSSSEYSKPINEDAEGGDGVPAAPTAHLQNDPRLGEDVPPVPAIPSSLNLPGTFPRDISPVRPSSAHGSGPVASLKASSRGSRPASLAHRPSTAPGPTSSSQVNPSMPNQFLPPPKSARSMREGRSPRSRKGASQRHSKFKMAGGQDGLSTPPETLSRSRKVDLSTLLAGIGDGNHDEDENDGLAGGQDKPEKGKEGRDGEEKIAVVRPPY